MKRRLSGPRYHPLAAAVMVVCATPILIPAPAIAQSTGALEEIVVTAQRREESLQETPVAITAFTRSRLMDMGVLDVAEIGGFAPNVSIEKQPSSNSNMGIYIRGIGENETALLNDPKVGMYIDGVYMSKTIGGVFDILDLERIEILRGPQGTLFGRNSTGGAINVTTQKPSGEFAVRAEASTGRFGYRRYGGSVDLPAVANISTKLTAFTSRSDGWARNRYEGPPLHPANKVEKNLASFDNDTYRIALRWEPVDNLVLDYSYDRTRNSGVGTPFQVTHVKDSLYDGVNTTPFPFAFLGGELYQQMADDVGDPHKRRSRFELAGVTEEWLDVDGHTFTAEWALEPFTLKYIFGDRETTSGYGSTDLGGGAYFARDALYGGGDPVLTPVFLAAIDKGTVEMRTHEFQIFGDAFNGRVDYIGGVFVYREEVYQENPQTFSLPIAFLLDDPDLAAMYDAMGFCQDGICTGSQRLPLPFPAPFADPNGNGLVDFIYGQTSWSRAIYGQATYHLNDQLDLTAGLRYTRDRKRAFLFNETLGHLSIDDRIVASDEWDNWSGMVNLSYRINPNANVYAKYTTGYNSGGFSARAATASGFATPFDEEKVRTVEIGFKSEWLDRRLRFNSAVFRNDYKDIQVAAFEAGSGGASSVVVNAGEGVYQGIEFDITLIPIPALTLDLTYGYLDTELKEYMQRDSVTDEMVDISGRTRALHAPKHTGAFGAQYDFPRTRLGYISARTDVQYKSGFVFHPFQNQYDAARSRTLVNARLSMNEIPLSGDQRSQLRISLWVKNLTNEEYRSYGIDFGSLGYAGNVFGEPRTYGLDLTYTFD